METPSPTVAVVETERELPMLAGIGFLFQWIEEFLVIVSGPLLTVGLGIGLVDLLSDGALLVTSPVLLYVWAIAQTVGVDGQMIGAWAKVGKQFRKGNWLAGAGYLLLGLILAYVGFVSGLVFAYQASYHITIAEALAKLHIDSVSWLWQRTAVSVGLVCLSGLLRYTPPRVQLSLEEQKRRIAERAELQADKREAQAQGFKGLVGLAKGVAASAAAKGTSVADVPLG